MNSSLKRRKAEIKRSIDSLIDKAKEAESKQKHKDAEVYRHDASFLIDLLEEFRCI